MFGTISETPYDLRFRLFGISTRVHPMFWLVMALLGSHGERTPLGEVLIFVIAGFLSIVVHEYGHGLMNRAFGVHPFIVLYGMGGVCVSEAGRMGPWRRLAVLAAGPAAGLSLGFAALAASIGLAFTSYQPTPILLSFLGNLFIINLFWTILNLLPVFPLDGGQMLGVVLGMVSPRSGRRWTHVVSLVTAGIVAIAWAVHFQEFITPLFFASLAFTNYQLLQSHQRMSVYGEDVERWD